MQQKQVLKIISTKRYRSSDFNLVFQSVRDLITAINQMQISQQSFKIIRILIRYFRFPVLILFQKFYQRLQRDKKLMLQLVDDQKKTATIVMQIMEDRQYYTLKFYLKAGFFPLEDKPKEVEQPKEFKEFVFRIDSRLRVIVGDKSKYILDQLQFTLQQLVQYRQKQELTPIFQLCLLAYEDLIKDIKTEIQKSLLARPQGVLIDPRLKFQQEKIMVQSGRGLKEINDRRICQDHLCCRPYFYQNQIINEPETITQQYKRYTYPYNKFLKEILLKTIVGFLNARGGIIYIGIRENNETKKRVISGETYNQSLKEQVLKDFRYLCQRISPEIVNNQLYKLQYVPIRDESGFLAGQYIIRLRISKGQKDELYSFKNYDSEQLIAFRTANEVLVRKLGQEILELYRQKLSQPDELEESNHPGTCKKPEIGRPLYENIKGPSNASQQDTRWLSKKPTYQSKNAEYTISAYLFLGKKQEVLPDIKKYYHEDYKGVPVIETVKNEDAEVVRVMIESSGRSVDYVPITMKMSIEGKYSTGAEKMLTDKNVMFVPERTSGGFIFNTSREAVCAGNILINQKIPFKFVCK